MCKDAFVHTHTHTSYSLLDGLCSPEVLVKRAVELGQPGLAITDHGNLYGVIDFYRKAKEYDIIPIIGFEGYMCRFGESMHTKDTSNRENFHMLLFAENETGYQNLLKLSSMAFLDGFYNKPRFDFNALEAHSAGLIATSGCMASPIPRAIAQNLAGEANQAYIKQLFEWHIDVFGRENFFIEIQDHIGIPELVDINSMLLEYAEHYNLRPIVTNDAHYAKPEDATPHDVLLCVQTNSKVWQTQRMSFTDEEYYLKSRSEMERAVAKYNLGPECLDITLEIMERCSGLELESKQKHHMPNITIPSKYKDYDEMLHDLAYEGMRDKYGPNWKNNQELVGRVDNELSVIKETGFSVYYIIIWDICQFAARNSIIWNVRGSGAGSIVSYVIGLSFVDPIAYDLVFERFLNIHRVSIPDMDMDFPDNQRESIINHLIDTYGEANVSQIITFGRMKARMCIRDVARAYGWPQEKVDVLANKILNTPGKPITIENSLDPDSEYYSSLLADAYKKNYEEKELLDMSKFIENTVRHTGVHAAAVAITDKPMIEYTPLARSRNSITKNITQFDYPTLESLGLLKVDILGLATLTIINEACALIKQRHGVELKYEDIPFDRGDIQDALALLSSGEVKGVFQVESHGLRQILMELKPTSFEQIMDVISLYRPGPIDYIPLYIKRSFGTERIEYPHECLTDILASTQGILIYQEQIIRSLQVMAGYSLGEADIIRKAISKKDVAKIDKEKKIFVEKSQANGFTEQEAVRVFDDIEKFALYGFNRAHAASYARMTMVTAWLKVNYPAEFILACLIVEKNKPEKVAGYVLEAKRMGIDVFTPDIQHSQVDFTIVDNSGSVIPAYSKYDYNLQNNPAILFGIKSIKHVGDEVAEMIPKFGKNIKDLNGILSLDFSIINTRSLRRLIGSGLFDSVAKRELLFGNEDKIIELGTKAQDYYVCGQRSFINPELSLEKVENADLLHEEKESLGVWITNHPLEKYYNQLYGIVTHNIYDAHSNDDSFDCTMILITDSVKEHTTKKGKPMAFVTFSDIYGTIEGVMFNDAYEKYRKLLIEDKPVVVIGKVSYLREEPTIVINSLHDTVVLNNVPKRPGIVSISVIAPSTAYVRRELSYFMENRANMNLQVKVYNNEDELIGTVSFSGVLSSDYLNNNTVEYYKESIVYEF